MENSVANKTLEHISQIFGVSAMTVSNALNGRKGVSEKKAHAIRSYATKVGYQTDFRASSLTRRRTRMIGVCLRSTPTVSWWAQLIYEVQKKLYEADFRMTLGIAPEGVEQERSFIDHFMSLRCEAVLLGPLGHSYQYEALSQRLASVPYVLGFETFSELPIDSVSINEYQGMQMAVDYLYEQGHRHIGHFGVPVGALDKPQLRTRHSGFLHAMGRLNLPVYPEWIRVSREEESRFKAFLDLVAQGTPMPTAWCTHSDVDAARLIRILNEHGYSVPQDVSVIGFDNLEISSLVHPQITTIGFDVKRQASSIVAQLLEHVERIHRGETRVGSIEKILNPPLLIERKSVARHGVK
jgi:DNA-binding LacI/PurR family transcriptional regulator